MEKVIFITVLMLLLAISVFAQSRAYYQKVVAQDGSDLMTLVTGTGASYTAPNYHITANIVEVPIEYLQTGITPTQSLRLVLLGNGTTVPYYAAVYVQLGAFPTQWIAGETLHITVTKTDIIPNQSTEWYFTIPNGLATINITNPTQEIPPMNTDMEVLLSSFSAVTTEQNTVMLSWTTELEQNLLGYNVFRSNDNILNNAVQLNPTLIGGTNTATPQSYFYDDAEVDPVTVYYYWLQMVFMDSSTQYSNYETVTTLEMPFIPELDSFTGTPFISFFMNVAYVSVDLEWTTNSETNVMGYNVFCSPDTINMPFQQINSEMIPGTNTSTAHVYSFFHLYVSTLHWYYYWIEMVDMEGSFYKSPTIAVLTHDIGNPPTPQPSPVTHINNVYPNPFHENSIVNIALEVKSGELATLAVYNIRGQLVKTYNLNPGQNQVIQWNGKDEKGNVCGSGVYFCKLSSQTGSSSRKVVIIK